MNTAVSYDSSRGCWVLAVIIIRSLPTDFFVIGGGKASGQMAESLEKNSRPGEYRRWHCNLQG
jgi:hypothetical protein